MKGQPFYGGYAAVIGGFVLMAMLHSMLQSCFSLFLVPATETMGIPRSLFSLSTSVVALMSLLLSPFMGKWLSGRYARQVFLFCVGGLGLAYASYGLAKGPLMLYSSAVLVGIFSCGATSVPVSIIITSWFPQASGTAISAAYAGSGIGGAVLSPLITAAIARYGWQHAFLIFGLLMTAVGLTTAVFLLRPNPNTAVGVDKAESKEQGDPVKLLRYRGYFWVYLLGISCMCLVAFSSLSQLSAFLTDTYNAEFSGVIFSCCLLMLTPSKIILGLLYDRKGVNFTTICVMGACTVSMLLLLALTDAPVWFAWVMAAFFAIGNCCGTVSPPVTASAIFGAQHYGRLFGLVNLFCMLGNMIGPPAAAWSYDQFSSYRPVWIVCAALSLLSIACILYAHRCCKKDSYWQQMWASSK